MSQFAPRPASRSTGGSGLSCINNPPHHQSGGGLSCVGDPPRHRGGNGLSCAINPPNTKPAAGSRASATPYDTGPPSLGPAATFVSEQRSPGTCRFTCTYASER